MAHSKPELKSQGSFTFIHHLEEIPSEMNYILQQQVSLAEQIAGEQ